MNGFWNRKWRYLILTLTALVLSASFFAARTQITTVLAAGGAEACALTIEHLNGQGRFGLAGAGRFGLAGAGRFGLAGAEGGDLTPAEVQQVIDNIVGPEWITGVLNVIPYDDAVNTASVAILVVDDFYSGPFGPDNDLAYPHGESVLAVLRDALWNGLNDVGVNPTIGFFRVDISEPVEFDPNTFEEVPAPATEGYRADIVAARIQEAVSQAQGFGYEHFVINMSFSLIPCEDPATGFSFFDFIEYRRNNPQFLLDEDGDPVRVSFPATESDAPVVDLGLLEYLTEVLLIPNPEAYLASLMGEQCSSGDLGDLRALLQEYLNISASETNPGDPVFIPVASSGNFRDIFGPAPFAPACWEQTIASSASLGTDSPLGLWEFSQDGNIITPGAWHFLEDQNYYRAGTSFSAPLTSLIAALYATYEDVPCDFGTPANGQPPLTNPNDLSNPEFPGAPGDPNPLACDVPFQQEGNPSIDLEIDPTSVIVEYGESATFGYRITNTGDVPLNIVSLFSSPNGGCSQIVSFAPIQPNDSVEATCNLWSNTSDYINLFTAVGRAPDGRVVTDTEQSEIAVVNPPDIEITITPDTQTVPTGGIANFTITVENTGATDLRFVDVSAPDLVDDCWRSLDDLGIGEQTSYTCQQPNVTSNFNTRARVTAFTPNFQRVKDADRAAVQVEQGQTNTAPVAVVDAYTTAQDTLLNVVAPGVLVNDTDAEGNPLTALPVSGPSSGSLTLNADGSFTYTPNAGFSGSDSFTYRANDGQANSDVAMVTLTVTPTGQNIPPVAGDDSYSTDQDTPLNVAAPGVLANDTDADSNPLTALLVSGPSNGGLTFYATGAFDYVPNASYSGTDSFTYWANDGQANSNVATVTITVKPANLPTLSGPTTYHACPANGASDTITVTNVGSYQLRGQVSVWFTTGPDTRQLIAVYPVNHVGPADFSLTATYPPLASWPFWVDPSSGQLIGEIHVDVQIEVLDTSGAYVRLQDGSVLTLGPGQDWDVFCQTPPQPDIQPHTPVTYSLCPVNGAGDTVSVTGVGNRQLRGQVNVWFTTGPDSRQLIASYPVNHMGPADFSLYVTYPPLDQWPFWIDPTSGQPVGEIHVDMQLEVLDANGNYILRDGGSVLTLGPGQDWDVFCLTPPQEPEQPVLPQEIEQPQEVVEPEPPQEVIEPAQPEQPAEPEQPEQPAP